MVRLAYRMGRKATFFLLGMGSVLDVSGHLFLTKTYPRPDTLDAIGEDFQKVGSDIQFAMNTVGQTQLPEGKITEQLELSLH